MSKENYEELFKLNARAQQEDSKMMKILRETEAVQSVKPLDALRAPSHEQYIGGYLDEQTEQIKRTADALDELAHLKEIADAAEAQAQYAKELAEQAKIDAIQADKDAKFSKVISIISIIIAFASLLVAIILPLVRG